MKRIVYCFALVCVFPTASFAQEEGPTAIDLAPDLQKKFIATINEFKTAYENAGNDMQAGAQRPLRAKAICSLLRDRRIKDWTGYVTTLSSNNDGLGVLTIRIADDLHVGTWNNAFSDSDSNTLMQPDSEAFQQAAALEEGAAVKFSGRFVKGKADCIQEQSISQSGAMTDPEFSIQFSAVEGLPNVAKPARKSLLKSLFD